jgi:hypothetical protein
VAEQGEVDHEQEDEGHRQCHGLYHGPDVKRVDLAPNDPLERPLRHVIYNINSADQENAQFVREAEAGHRMFGSER